MTTWRRTRRSKGLRIHGAITIVLDCRHMCFCVAIYSVLTFRNAGPKAGPVAVFFGALDIEVEP